MPKLTLTFTGLCTFQFNDHRDEAKVLLVGQTGQMSGMNEYMPLMDQGEMHVPALVAARGAFDDDATDLEITTFFNAGYLSATTEHDNCKAPAMMGLVRLERQELAIDGAECNSLVVIDRDDLSQEMPRCPPDKESEKWISWVAPLHEIDPDRGNLDDSCCAPAGSQQLPNAVGARLCLTEGRLYTSILAGYPSTLFVFKFSTMDGNLTSDCEQALAEVVTFEVELEKEAKQVVFCLTDLACAKKGKLVLNPDAQGNFFAEVKNLPLLDVVGSREPSQPEPGRHRSEDMHFDHFYRFSLDAPAAGQGLVPLLVDTCAGVLGPRNPWCPPGRFS
jgi:hypothetical protein